MMNNKTNHHNCSIDICRYLCAILVVAIHTEPFSDIYPPLGFGIKHILARIAVPFFFAVSGYFYSRKLYSGKKPFGPYVCRLLITYLGWFLIYFFVSLIQNGFDSPVSFSINAIKGLFYRVSPSHFWYFPALIYCVCLFTLLYRIGMKQLMFPLLFLFGSLGILGGSLLAVGQQIPLLNRLYLHSNYDLLRKYLLMAPSYFLLGVILNHFSARLLRFSSRSIFLSWIFSGLFGASEIAVIKTITNGNLYTGMSFGLYLCTFLTLLMLLRNPFPQYKLLSACCKTLANFTYYSHILFINLINQFNWNILKIDLTNTQMFFVCTLLTGGIGLILFKRNHKWLNYLIK